MVTFVPKAKKIGDKSPIGLEVQILPPIVA